jgi:uncharacterized protein (UPF0332 family)
VSFHRDLIEQAEHLAKRDLKRPRQASLRRAISTAYYALFHMLIDDAVRKLVPNTPPILRTQVQRAFTHSDMRNACEQFAKPSGTLAHLLVQPVELELQLVANAFINLQYHRHTADYDFMETYDRITVLRIIEQAEAAVAAWSRVRDRPNANVFLAALLLNRRWNK